MSSLSDELFFPGATFGHYQIVSRIGEGGMASVWRGVHVNLRKPVAIKTLRGLASQSPIVRERFLREGEAIARIRHANVVEVFDVGFVEDTPYMVMEYLEGEDLKTLFARRGAMSVLEAADVMVPVCAAIAAAHDEGIVHRDLKPANIFLARTRDRGVVPKVLDFGISRLHDDRTGRLHTGTEVVLGTPRYMAPEQVRGARLADARSDQYALGVLTYQAVTGAVPIDDPVVFELLRKVVAGAVTPPGLFRPDLPPDFERLLLRALARLPDARFPSVRSFGAALLPFASERTRVLFADALRDDAARDDAPVDPFGDAAPPPLPAPASLPPSPVAPAVWPPADPGHTLAPVDAPRAASPASPRASKIAFAAAMLTVVGLTAALVAGRPPPRAAAVTSDVRASVAAPVAAPLTPVAPPAPPAPQVLAQPAAQVLAQPAPQVVEAPVAEVLAPDPVAVAPSAPPSPPQPVVAAPRPPRSPRPVVRPAPRRTPRSGGINVHDID